MHGPRSWKTSRQRSSVSLRGCFITRSVGPRPNEKSPGKGGRELAQRPPDESIKWKVSSRVGATEEGATTDAE